MFFRRGWVLCVAMGCGTAVGDPDAIIGAPDAMIDALVVTDCTGAADGTSCGSSLFCVDGECVPGECGDGFHDPLASEECDDGNDDPADGCRPDCTFTCHEAAECDDRDPCSGEETCSGGACAAGTPLDDGTACTNALRTGVCRSGVCAPVGCGDSSVGGSEECDDGNTTPGDGCELDCTYTCTETRPCEVDNDVCNGVPTCNLGNHTCTPADPLDCDDRIDCTTDTCDALTGCANTLIDMDGDGQAPDTYACGTDCNDNRDDVYLGAPELCDSIDQNCDGEPLPAETPVWYVDCDDDGYAANGDVFRQQCDEPSPSTCGGGWTARVPAGGDVDCNDLLDSVHPGAMETVGDGVDQSCDGAEVCWVDGDRDGYRWVTTVASMDLDCSDPGEAPATAMADCNDGNAAIRPGATEGPGDEIDQNCDGQELCYANSDGDGYRTTSTLTSTDLDCLDAGEARATVASGDCNDGNGAINPGASESYGDAGDVDENCDGNRGCYLNSDGDSYRSASTGLIAGTCATAGYAYASMTSGDCCDTDARAFPGQSSFFPTPRGGGCFTDTSNDFDFDCDGLETKELTDTFTGCTRTNCTLGRAGWPGTVPECGAFADMVTGCTPEVLEDPPVLICALEYLPVQLACR